MRKALRDLFPALIFALIAVGGIAQAEAVDPSIEAHSSGGGFAGGSGRSQVGAVQRGGVSSLASACAPGRGGAAVTAAPKNTGAFSADPVNAALFKARCQNCHAALGRTPPETDTGMASARILNGSMPPAVDPTSKKPIAPLSAEQKTALSSFVLSL